MTLEQAEIYDDLMLLGEKSTGMFALVAAACGVEFDADTEAEPEWMHAAEQIADYLSRGRDRATHMLLQTLRREIADVKLTLRAS